MEISIALIEFKLDVIYRILLRSVNFNDDELKPTYIRILNELEIALLKRRREDGYRFDVDLMGSDEFSYRRKLAGIDVKVSNPNNTLTNPDDDRVCIAQVVWEDNGWVTDVVNVWYPTRTDDPFISTKRR